MSRWLLEQLPSLQTLILYLPLEEGHKPPAIRISTHAVDVAGVMKTGFERSVDPQRTTVAQHSDCLVVKMRFASPDDGAGKTDQEFVQASRLRYQEEDDRDGALGMPQRIGALHCRQCRVRLDVGQADVVTLRDVFPLPSSYWMDAADLWYVFV